MELSVLLDLPVPAMTIADPGAKQPGGEGAEADAFAALLAALVLPPVTPPTPESIEVAEPEAAVIPVFASPELVSGSSPRDQKVELTLAPAPIALSSSFSSPPPLLEGGARDEHLERDVTPAVATPAPTPSAPAPTARTHPAAHVLGTPDPVVAPAPIALPSSFSSPPPPQEGGARDEKPSAPVVVPTEVVRLPSRVVDVASVAAPTAPAAPATPAEQVVKAVVPLRQLPDGTHRIVLELRPADLGAVRVELSIDAGMVHLGLHSDVDATAQVLHAALPEIRAQLDAAGLVAGRLAVDAGATGRRDQRGAWETDADRERTDRRDHSGSDNEDDTTGRRSFVAVPGRVDVLL